MQNARIAALVTCHLALALLAGCGSKTDAATVDDTTADAGADADVTPGFDDAAIAELNARGWTKYAGKFTPSATDVGATSTTYTFSADKHGPICMQGSEFRMSTRDGASDDLLVYLMGGGACWTGKCAATTTTSGAPLVVGWTDGNAEKNPLGDFDLAFFGYCDGSAWTGDGEVPDTMNGAPDGVRYHHGFANLSAGLDVAKKKYPSPKRIVLAGSSAGGYGTIVATGLVRLAWPHTPLFVINDAGLGLTNPSDPSMYATIVKEWNLTPHIPTDCQGCDSQFTPLITWALQHDPTLRVEAFSSYQDGVIGGLFLGMKGPDFKALLVSQTDLVHAAAPDRFERFFIDGADHTADIAGYYTVKVGDVGLPEWTGWMLSGDARWKDELQSP